MSPDVFDSSPPERTATVPAERVYHPDGRSFTLRAGPACLRVTSGKGSAMIDVVEPEPTFSGPADLAAARIAILARLEALPSRVVEQPAPVELSRADRILAAAEQIQRGRAMIADGQALVDAGVEMLP